MTAGSTATAGPASSPVEHPAPAATTKAPVATTSARAADRVSRFITTGSLPARGRVADVKRLPLLAEGGRLLAHPRRDGRVGRDPLGGGVVTDVLRDLHRTEVRA